MPSRVLLSVAAVATLGACRNVIPISPLSATATSTLPASPTPTITPNLDADLTVTSAGVPSAPCQGVTLAAAGTQLTVSDASPFHLHDEVFLLQVQVPYGSPPAANAISRTGTLTSSLAPGFAFHQFALVTSTNNAPLLTLSSTHPELATAGGGSAELCRVPNYQRALISSSGSLVGAAWNGVSGGVIVFVTSSLELSGKIDGDGQGFRGGAVAAAADITCARSDTTDPGGGSKGEGIDGRWFGDGSDFTIGLGVQGIGAGGGDPCGASGGGGGNGGAGGNGGGDGTKAGLDNGGSGGLSVVEDPQTYPTLGGGAGGAATYKGTGSAGTAGGGLVWIIAQSATVTSSGQVSAVAEPPPDSTNNGSGGGGAGGSIVLQFGAGPVRFSGSVLANGADGGVTAGGGVATLTGGGGGGGGGRVHVPSGVATVEVGAGLGGAAPADNGKDGSSGLVFVDP